MHRAAFSFAVACGLASVCAVPSQKYAFKFTATRSTEPLYNPDGTPNRVEKFLQLSEMIFYDRLDIQLRPASVGYCTNHFGQDARYYPMSRLIDGVTSTAANGIANGWRDDNFKYNGVAESFIVFTFDEPVEIWRYNLYRGEGYYFADPITWTVYQVSSDDCEANPTVVHEVAISGSTSFL